MHRLFKCVRNVCFRCKVITVDDEIELHDTSIIMLLSSLQAPALLTHLITSTTTSQVCIRIVYYQKYNYMYKLKVYDMAKVVASMYMYMYNKLL